MRVNKKYNTRIFIIIIYYILLYSYIKLILYMYIYTPGSDYTQTRVREQGMKKHARRKFTRNHNILRLEI